MILNMYGNDGSVNMSIMRFLILGVMMKWLFECDRWCSRLW